MQNIIGNKYGKYTVLNKTKTDSGGRCKVLCRCDCGTEKYVDKYSLVYGKTKSCCGHKTSNLKHGMSYSLLHKTWKDFCRNFVVK